MAVLARQLPFAARMRTVTPIIAALALAACAAGPGASSGGGQGWTQQTSTALTGVSLLDVAPFGAGFVAVGNAPEVGPSSFGDAFTSTDGISWTAAATTPFKNATASVVGSVSEGVLALGSACSGECFGFDSWLSKDGATWAGPTSPEGDSSRPNGLVEKGSTIVAISSELIDPALNHYHGFVYLSTDATTWMAIAGNDVFDQAGLTGIASDGNGLVIVGSVLHEDGTRDGGAWTSTDGKAWASATNDGSFKGGLLQSVVHGKDGYLAVGSVGSDGAVWTSSDGTSWMRVDGGAFKGSTLADVAASGAGYLAIGRDATGGAAWTSADGKAWNPLAGIPGLSDARLIAAAVGQSKSIIVGQPVGATASGLVWAGPLP